MHKIKCLLTKIKCKIIINLTKKKDTRQLSPLKKVTNIFIKLQTYKKIINEF